MKKLFSILVIFFSLSFSSVLAADPTASWTVTHGVSGDVVKAMTEDRLTGKIYIIGKNLTGNGRFKIIRVLPTTLALDSAWGSGGIVYYDSSPVLQDEGEGITTDSSGNVYVTGMSDAGFPDGINYRTIKYSSAGTPLWNKSTHLIDDWDWGYDLALNSAQTALYVVGENGIVRYTTSTGTSTILQTSLGISHRAVAIDASENIWTGSSGGASLKKYNSSGTQTWSLATGASCAPNGRALPLSASGNAYIPSVTTLDTSCIYLGKVNSNGLNVVGSGGASAILPAFGDMTIDGKSSLYMVGGTILAKKNQASQNVWSNNQTLSFSAQAVTVASSTGDIFVAGDIFKVSRFTQSDYTSSPVSSPITWSESITIGGAVKLSHLTELRTWANSRRASVGLASFNWASATLSVGDPVRAAHINELRSAVSSTYAQCAQSAPTWTTNPSLTTGTAVRANHFTELRTNASNAPLCGARRVFLSSQVYTGNFGGFAAADTNCQNLAQAANLSGTFKAWVVATSTALTPGMRFSSSSFELPYRLVDNTLIANNFEDLTDGILANLVNRSETGSLITTTTVAWTNVTIRGIGVTSANHCTSWTSNSSALSGNYGNTATTSFRWTQDTSALCNTLRRLYCIQQ